MDEKRSTFILTPSAYGRKPRRSRGCLVVLSLFGLFLHFSRHISFLGNRGGKQIFGPPTHQQQLHSLANQDHGLEASVTSKIPLEAHIMSKCPDARDCLRDMILPTMMRVYDKVNFTLSFIGTPADGDDGVACKHGAEECLGNIIELCAQRLYPEPKIFLGFTMCLTADFAHIPQRSLIEGCALEHAIDFGALNGCATKDNGALGVGMLRESVLRTSDAGVTKSCTVRLNQQIYCVRDGRKWKDCPSGPGVNDLVVAIEKLYRSSADADSVL